MIKYLQFSLVFLMLVTMTANGQLVIKNSQQNQLCVITQAGKVGIGTAAGIEPLGKVEIRTDNLRRIYTNEGSLYLTGGLRSEDHINTIAHYTQINGGGWNSSAGMYDCHYSAIQI